MTGNDRKILNQSGHVNFVKTTNKHQIRVYTLKNENGMRVQISNAGNRIVNLFAKDMMGRCIDLVVSTENVFGDISNIFKEEGIKIDLMHVVWDAVQIDESSVIFTYSSGNSEVSVTKELEVKVSYKLTRDNGLKVTCEATTGRPLSVQCHQPFFNLNGSGNVFNHYIQVSADNYFTLDGSGMSTGNLECVSGTPFDFKKATTIVARINDNNGQLRNGNGYNHTFVINKHSSRTPVARVKGDKSGITLELCTDDHWVHFYCSKFSNRNNGLNDHAGLPAGFALIPQHFPDLKGGSLCFFMVLSPGEFYKSVCLYRFKTD
ncbi:MAG: hypothetical protein ACHQIM_21920 [Sphingobacteriales bacterium]